MIFWNYVHYLRIVFAKGRRKQMWKHEMSLIMSQWNVCWTQNEIETWFHKIENIRIVFSHVIWNETFSHEFSMFDHTYIFFSFIVIYIHLRCYITIDVHLIVCVYVKQKTLKDLLDQFFCQCSFYVLLFYYKIILIFDMIWLNII